MLEIKSPRTSKIEVPPNEPEVSRKTEVEDPLEMVVLYMLMRQEPLFEKR